MLTPRFVALLGPAVILAGLASQFHAPGLAAPPQFRGVVFDQDRRLGGDAMFGDDVGQTEPAIAVNPADPLNAVAGFHDVLDSARHFICRFASTRDGGLTWENGGATPLQDATHFCFDPSVGGDAQGRFYYAYIDVRRGVTNDSTLDLAVARSDDGGRTFAEIVIAARSRDGFNLDKPYLAVDAQPRSPFRGRVYVAYDDFADSGIRLVSSSDGGRTWGESVLIVPNTDFLFIVDGAVPVVAPDGTVYVFYAQYRFTFGILSIRFVKSADGGRTWSAPQIVARDLPSPGNFHLKNAERDFGTDTGPGFRSNSFPAAAAGPDGTLYVAWVDFPAGTCGPEPSSATPCTNADVRLAVSRDGGRRWTAPVKVSDDAGAADQFFPWIAAHPDGLLSIVWLDKRLDPDNINFDAFYTNTYDGAHFLPNVRVSTVTSQTGTNNFIGDYQGIAATTDTVLPVWNDARDGSPSVFTARGTLLP